ncbi:hypothetical protein KI387_042958, partial [Taxus chinensis]
MGLASDGEWKEWLKHDFDTYCKEYRALSQEAQALLSLKGFCDLRRRRSGSRRRITPVDVFFDELIQEANGKVESPAFPPTRTFHAKPLGQEEEEVKEEEPPDGNKQEKGIMEEELKEEGWLDSQLCMDDSLRNEEQKDSDLHIEKTSLVGETPKEDSGFPLVVHSGSATHEKHTSVVSLLLYVLPFQICFHVGNSGDTKNKDSKNGQRDSLVQSPIHGHPKVWNPGDFLHSKKGVNSDFVIIMTDFLNISASLELFLEGMSIGLHLGDPDSKLEGQHLLDFSPNKSKGSKCMTPSCGKLLEFVSTQFSFDSIIGANSCEEKIEVAWEKGWLLEITHDRATIFHFHMYHGSFDKHVYEGSFSCKHFQICILQLMAEFVHSMWTLGVLELNLTLHDKEGMVGNDAALE